MLKAQLLYRAFKYMQSKNQGKMHLDAPMEAQENLLQEILHHQASTKYGRKYQFDRIHSIEDFQRQVPLTTITDCQLPLPEGRSLSPGLRVEIHISN